MGMATIITRRIVCDVGGARCPEDELETFRIIRDGARGQSRLLVLCHKHAAPILKLWDQAKTVATRAEKGAVVEMEEIEAMKQRARRAR